MSIQQLPMNSGKAIPQLGLGTYKMSDSDAVRAVTYALKLGYRHIDTAQMYGNEAAVGRAIKESGIAREEIFITSKLDNPNHPPALARESFTKTLEALQTDYIDLFLIHWPLPDQFGGDYLSTWKTLEEFAAAGRARSIGVSNFQTHHLETLIEGSDTVPAVDQFELHPYFLNADLADYCRAHDIQIEAWAPLVRGMIVAEPSVSEIAANHDCTPAQAVLAWHLGLGHIIFPKSVTESRIKENFGAQNISLTPSEMELLGSMDRGEAGRTGFHPDTMTKYAG